MQLMERDIAILETIYAFDGVISLKQVDRLFFSGYGSTTARARMRLLYDNHFVDMPSILEQHEIPYGETVYWLERRGAEYVAGRQGVTLSELKYLKRPRWSQLTHDLTVNDVRIAVRSAVSADTSLSLEQWVSEGVFLADPDTVRYQVGLARSAKRQVRPDGFFAVKQTLSTGEVKQYAFLLEVDLATHSTRRFARDKVRSGVAYLKSNTFAARFGVKFGRWIVVTTSEKRLEHLKAQTERVGGSRLYLFTTFDKLFAAPPLTAPIWVAAGDTALRPLIE